MGWEWLTMDEIWGRIVAAAVTAFLVALAGRMVRMPHEHR